MCNCLITEMLMRIRPAWTQLFDILSLEINSIDRKRDESPISKLF